MADLEDSKIPNIDKIFREIYKGRDISVIRCEEEVKKVPQKLEHREVKKSIVTKFLNFFGAGDKSTIESVWVDDENAIDHVKRKYNNGESVFTDFQKDWAGQINKEYESIINATTSTGKGFLDAMVKAQIIDHNHKNRADKNKQIIPITITKSSSVSKAEMKSAIKKYLGYNPDLTVNPVINVSDKFFTNARDLLRDPESKIFNLDHVIKYTSSYHLLHNNHEEYVKFNEGMFGGGGITVCKEMNLGDEVSNLFEAMKEFSGKAKTSGFNDINGFEKIYKWIVDEVKNSTSKNFYKIFQHENYDQFCKICEAIEDGYDRKGIDSRIEEFRKVIRSVRKIAIILHPESEYNPQAKKAPAFRELGMMMRSSAYFETLFSYYAAQYPHITTFREVINIVNSKESKDEVDEKVQYFFQDFKKILVNSFNSEKPDLISKITADIFDDDKIEELKQARSYISSDPFIPLQDKAFLLECLNTYSPFLDVIRPRAVIYNPDKENGLLEKMLGNPLNKDKEIMVCYDEYQNCVDKIKDYNKLFKNSNAQTLYLSASNPTQEYDEMFDGIQKITFDQKMLHHGRSVEYSVANNPDEIATIAHNTNHGVTRGVKEEDRNVSLIFVDNHGSAEEIKKKYNANVNVKTNADYIVSGKKIENPFEHSKFDQEKFTKKIEMGLMKILLESNGIAIDSIKRRGFGSKTPEQEMEENIRAIVSDLSSSPNTNFEELNEVVKLYGITEKIEYRVGKAFEILAKLFSNAGLKIDDYVEGSISEKIAEKVQGIKTSNCFIHTEKNGKILQIMAKHLPITIITDTNGKFGTGFNNTRIGSALTIFGDVTKPAQNLTPENITNAEFKDLLNSGKFALNYHQTQIAGQNQGRAGRYDKLDKVNKYGKDGAKDFATITKGIGHAEIPDWLIKLDPDNSYSRLNQVDYGRIEKMSKAEKENYEADKKYRQLFILAFATDYNKPPNDDVSKLKDTDFLKQIREIISSNAFQKDREENNTNYKKIVAGLYGILAQVEAINETLDYDIGSKKITVIARDIPAINIVALDRNGSGQKLEKIEEDIIDLDALEEGKKNETQSKNAKDDHVEDTHENKDSKEGIVEPSKNSSGENPTNNEFKKMIIVSPKAKDSDISYHQVSSNTQPEGTKEEHNRRIFTDKIDNDRNIMAISKAIMEIGYEMNEKVGYYEIHAFHKFAVENQGFGNAIYKEIESENPVVENGRVMLKDGGEIDENSLIKNDKNFVVKQFGDRFFIKTNAFEKFKEANNIKEDVNEEMGIKFTALLQEKLKNAEVYTGRREEEIRKDKKIEDLGMRFHRILPEEWGKALIRLQKLYQDR